MRTVILKRYQVKTILRFIRALGIYQPARHHVKVTTSWLAIPYDPFSFQAFL